MKKDFDTDVLLNNVVTHFQLLSVTFIEYENVKGTCHKDKDILGKMSGVYVTYVADGMILFFL